MIQAHRTPDRAREIVAVFDDAETLEQAVAALEGQGIPRAAISLLASEHAVEQKLGERYKRVEGLEDNPSVPRDTFVGWLTRRDPGYGLMPAMAFLGVVTLSIASQAILLPVLTATGGGVLIGAALRRLLRHRSVEQLHEQLQQGGLLMWVHVRSKEEEANATRLLKAGGARHVHAHSLSP